MIESKFMGFLGRIREGLARTTQQIVGRFEEIATRADAPDSRSGPVDVETIDALEELLISADVGLPATERIVEAVRARPRRGEPLRDLRAGCRGRGGHSRESELYCFHFWVHYPLCR